MRTFPLFTLFILAIAWLAHPASAAPSPASPDFTAVDRYVTAEMQAARIPGVALAIVQDDHIVHLQGYGVADPAGRAVAAGWALLLLLGLPQVAGRSLPFLLLYVPDLGYMLIASAALALGWGLLSLFVSLTDLTRNDRFGLNRSI